MIYKFQIHQAAIFLILFSGNVLSAQKIKTDWVKLEQQFASTSLKEYFYKKGSLFNEAEGISEDEEIPSALFFPVRDSTNKNLAFIFSIQSLESFKKDWDWIIKESISYTYQGRQCYYRETEHIQGLYMNFENYHVSVCIGFSKMAKHDQKFIEHLFDELKVEEIIKAAVSQ
jgi:hypothetical protein